MASNTYFNMRTFLNTPPPFNGESFELWKAIIKVFTQNFDLEWDAIINSSLIPSHYVNDKIVNKPYFLLN